MKLNSIILYHIKKLSKFSTPWLAINYLKKVNFKCIGTGCESEVFSREGFDYVIKIQHSAFENSGMHEGCPNEIHFVPTKIIDCGDFNIVIQPKCRFTIEQRFLKYRSNYIKFQKFIRKNFGVSDIHDGNIGFYNGRLMIFDWTIAES